MWAGSWRPEYVLEASVWSSASSSLSLVSSSFCSFRLQILHLSCLADAAMNVGLQNSVALIFHPRLDYILLYVLPSVRDHCLSPASGSVRSVASCERSWTLS